MRIIDSHQHFWRLDNPGHQWPDADWPRLYRHFGPADLRTETKDVPLLGTVLVQSQPDDRDTDWMLALAADEPMVLAVVGWVDLAHADAPARIAALARHKKFRGVRPMLQSIEDREWMLAPNLTPAIEALLEHDLRFDALVQPRHLPALARFSERWPDLPIVIDHAAKPDATTGKMEPWAEEIAALAGIPSVYCKLSGLRTEQAAGQSADLLQPYVAHLVARFGSRLMWGSDWPVLHHAGDRYRDWIDDALRLAGTPDDASRHAMLCGAAASFYSIDI
jgi:L-fuconolactonase